MPRYAMIIDASRCIDCKACLLACRQRNNVPQGYSRNWVHPFPDAAAPLGLHFQPGACMHCDDAPCVRACPTRATYKAADGSVRIDLARCAACGGCIEACPYNARYRHPQTGLPDKCDYCAGTPDMSPACVQVCPMRCRAFGDLDSPGSPAAVALAAGNPVQRVRPADNDTRPALAYVNGTAPLDWPQSRPRPLPLEAMSWVAGAVTVLGGVSLAGCAAVLLKNRLAPPTENDTVSRGDRHDHD